MQNKEPKRTAPIVFCAVAGVCLASKSTAFAELDIALRYLTGSQFSLTMLSKGIIPNQEREKDVQGDDRGIASIYSFVESGEIPFW
jgi:hypothetical protein